MSSPDTPSATVYLDKDFAGDGHVMAPGRYNLDYSQIAEDTISSIRVPEGWTVAVFRDRDFQGDSATYTADTADLGDYDNAISSLIVSDQPPAPRSDLSVGWGEATGITVDIEGGLLLLPPSEPFDYTFGGTR